MSELQHQRNKEQFDRLFGKVKRDSNLRTNNSPVKGVSLATILQDNGSGSRRCPEEDEVASGGRKEMQQTAAAAAGPVQSTLVSPLCISLDFMDCWSGGDKDGKEKVNER